MTAEQLPSTDSAWQPAPKALTIAAAEVQIFCASLEARDADRYEHTLSLDERLRADRFHFPRDRDHFVIARGLLRTIVGGYRRIAPQEVKFLYGENGKPALASPPGTASLHFNLAHSHGLALYAFSLSAKVGVDVEFVNRNAADLSIARRFFSPREYAELCALEPSKQREGFINCWTRKEAYLKCIGSGLSNRLDQVDVVLTPGELPAMLGINGDPGEAARWSLRHLTPKPGYVGALSLRAREFRMECWELTL